MKTFKKLVLISLMVTIVTVIYSCKKMPDAGFKADKTEAYVGETIVFSDNNEKCKNCTYTYDFGDGTNSSNSNSSQYYYYSGGYYGNGNNSNTIYSDRNPSHIYWTPGTYTVSQTIAVAGNLQKGKSKQISKSIQITIKSILADFTASQTTATTNDVITFTNTTQDKGVFYYYSGAYGWSFINTTDVSTNTTVVSTFGSSGSVTGGQAFARFNSPGLWKVTLTVGNGFYFNSKTIDITIN